MEGRKVLRASIKIFTTPIYIIERIIIAINYKSIIKDFETCNKIINSTQIPDTISNELVRTLIVAEDHRSELHYGTDPIAIARTIKLRVFNNKKQGASTIEQQLVRTITGRYEKTPRRKIREQVLATMISREHKKSKICKCYLAIAYYGHNAIGTGGIDKIKQESRETTNAELIALLKYPRRKNHCKLKEEKISRRAKHIEKLMSNPKLPILLSNQLGTDHD